MMLVACWNLPVNIKKTIISLLILLLFFQAKAATTTQLNFTANILRLSCELSVSNSSIRFNRVIASQLKGSQLSDIKQFSVNIKNCTGLPGTGLKPQVVISGNGFKSQDGKWIFRQDNSKLKNIGAMIFHKNQSPTYQDKELKPGDRVEFNYNGQDFPIGESINFHAGLTCGDPVTCNKAQKEPGEMKAIVYFDFRYD